MAIKKIIACSDIHVRNINRMEETYEVLSTFIEKCKGIAAEYNRDEVRIVVAGDIFTNKINVSNEANLAVSWFFRSLGEIAKTIVICGNHDCLMNNKGRVDSITPVTSIANDENVIYLDGELDYMSGVLTDDNIAWCLYSTFDDFNKPDLDNLEGYVKVGLIHGDINGATTDTDRVSTNKIDLGAFSGLDFVIAGHIHKHQELKKNGVKAVYCSSLIQQAFDENIYGHGFVVWDVENKDYEFVEVESDYGYYKFKISTPEDINNDKEQLINI